MEETIKGDAALYLADIAALRRDNYAGHISYEISVRRARPHPRKPRSLADFADAAFFGLPTAGDCNASCAPGLVSRSF